MSESYYYCGFEIKSSFDFPELERSFSTGDVSPISICSGDVKIPDRAELTRGPNWAVGVKEAYWWLDDIAKFRIAADGITVDAMPNAPTGLVRALTLEAPMIIAMQYRDAFCLTVSAVSDGKTVTAFRFLPGGGSSTAAAWQVCRKGPLSIVSDTLLRISSDDSGQPIAWPQGSGVLLWPKSQKLLGLEKHAKLEVRPELPLARFRLEDTRFPLPLKTIYTAALYRRLEASPQDDQNIVQARRPFRFSALRTAGRLWIDPMGRTPQHFAWCLAIARYCKIRTASFEGLYD